MNLGGDDLHFRFEGTIEFVVAQQTERQME